MQLDIAGLLTAQSENDLIYSLKSFGSEMMHRQRQETVSVNL